MTATEHSYAATASTADCRLRWLLRSFRFYTIWQQWGIARFTLSSEPGHVPVCVYCYLSGRWRSQATAIIPMRLSVTSQRSLQRLNGFIQTILSADPTLCCMGIWVFSKIRYFSLEPHPMLTLNLSNFLFCFRHGTVSVSSLSSSASTCVYNTMVVKAQRRAVRCDS